MAKPQDRTRSAQNRRRKQRLLCALLAVACTHAASAQQDPLWTIGCPSVPSVCVLRDDGVAEGFQPDLMALIAQDLDLSLRYVPGGVQETFERFSTGEVSVLVGVPANSRIAPNALFSEPVATFHTRIFAKAERVSELANSDLATLRAGMLENAPAAATARQHGLEARVYGTSVEELILDLLADRVDVILGAEAGVAHTIHKLGLDTKISPVGPTLSERPGTLVLHPAHAPFLDPLNSAIKSLEASGALADLRQKWLIDLPPPPPDRLVVGVTHYPPFQILEENGAISGFSVEVLRHLAARAALDIEFREISPEEWEMGPGGGSYDMLPQAPITSNREERMLFSQPVFSESYSVFMRAESETDQVLTLTNLAGLQVGASQSDGGYKLIHNHPSIESIRIDDPDRLAEALVGGQVDAILYRTNEFRTYLQEENQSAEIVEITSATETLIRAPALRFGLEPIQARLDAVTPGFLLSDEYDTLKRQWLDDPVFWTRDRILSVSMGVAAALVALLAALFWVRRQDRRAEHARRFSFLDDIARNLPIRIALLGSDRHFLYANDTRYDGLTFAKENDIRGQAYSSYLDWFLRTSSVKMTGKSFDEVHQTFVASADTDGTILEFETPGPRSFVRRTVHLGHGLTLFVVEDVSEDRRIRRQLEDQTDRLREEQTRLTNVLEVIQSGVVGFSNQGELIVVNSAARRLLNISDASSPRQWPSDAHFLATDTMQAVPREQDPVLRSMAGAELSGETFILDRGAQSAQHTYVRASSKQLPATSGSDVSVLLVLDDITEQEVTRQQNERASRLDALGQLTGGIAHDYNNLMATIEYSLELAQDSTSDSERADFMETARRSIRRGSALSRRLLSFAKQQPGAAQTFRVSAFLDEFLELSRPAVEENIEIKVIPGPTDLAVHCDLAQLENALLNLVINARDAMQESQTGQQITISASQVLPPIENEGPSALVEIAVSDDGPGMSEHVKARAVDPFFTTKTHKGGSGLGLASVYGFVEQANGYMKIHTQQGHGTSICLYLPTQGTAGQKPAMTQTARETDRGDAQTILLAEDEEDLRFMISKMLQALGYNVLEAKNAPDALAILESEQAQSIDLLLSDVIMPGGMNGFELGQRTRSILPNLPVVYMSGYAGHADVDMGDAVGELLQKPCPRAILSAALKRALDRADA